MPVINTGRLSSISSALVILFLTLSAKLIFSYCDNCRLVFEALK